jgi:hypothetical protein
MMAEPGFLTKQVGPLPVWGYLAAGTGGLLLFGLMGHKGSAAAAAPQVAPAAAQALMAPFGVGQGSSVYDPNTGQLKTAPQSGMFGGGFFANFSKFIGGLTNAPNTISLADGTGAMVSISNGISTWGGGNGSPLNIVAPVLNPGQMWASPAGSIMENVYLTQGQSFVDPRGYQFSGGQVINPGQTLAYYGNSGAGYSQPVSNMNPGQSVSYNQPGYPYNAGPVTVYGQNPSGSSSQPVSCVPGSPGCYKK